MVTDIQNAIIHLLQDVVGFLQETDLELKMSEITLTCDLASCTSKASFLVVSGWISMVQQPLTQGWVASTT